MKNFLFLFLGFLLFRGQVAMADTLPHIENMCPKLPSELQAIKPKVEDYVTLKKGEPGFTKQVTSLFQASNDFKRKYRKQHAKLEKDWEEYKKKQYPSQRRFLGLLAKGADGDLSVEDNDILKEVKSVCWSDEMGEHEYEELNMCNPLKNPPTSENWNRILLCTVERSKLLNITLF